LVLVFVPNSQFGHDSINNSKWFVSLSNVSQIGLTLLVVLYFKSLAYQIRSKRHYVINHQIIFKRHWVINSQNTKQLIESMTNLRNVGQRQGPFWVINRVSDQFENLV